MSEDIINKLYKIPTSTSIFQDSFFMNLVILLFLVFMCIYLHIKTQIEVNSSVWNTMKCDPRYIYVSGFLKNDSGRGAMFETIKNYKDCTDQSVSSVINKLKTEMTFNKYNQDNKLMNNKMFYDILYDDNRKDIKVQNEEVTEDFDIDLSLNTTNAAYYLQLKNLGIYVDQMDAAMNYVYEYMRGYLSFLFLKYQKDGDEDNQEKVKILLDEHFDGIEL
tara:strand:- start:878 stop:1534 length:657 start_codon:yes stop_codon:yes gene_type:complete